MKQKPSSCVIISYYRTKKTRSGGKNDSFKWDSDGIFIKRTFFLTFLVHKIRSLLSKVDKIYCRYLGKV